jgi:hypothetical protein
MPKAKLQSTDAADKIIMGGTEALNEGVAKATEQLEKLATFNKETMDAISASAQAAYKGLEKLGSEWAAFATHQGEEFSGAAKALLEAKTVQAVFEVQASYAKTFVDGYVKNLAKMGDVATGIARDAMEPLQSRMNAFTELMQIKAA